MISGIFLRSGVNKKVIPQIDIKAAIWAIVQIPIPKNKLEIIMDKKATVLPKVKPKTKVLIIIIVVKGCTLGMDWNINRPVKLAALIRAAVVSHLTDLFKFI